MGLSPVNMPGRLCRIRSPRGCAVFVETGVIRPGAHPVPQEDPRFSLVLPRSEGNGVCVYFWKRTATSAGISYEIQSTRSTKVLGGAGGEGLCVYPSSKEGGPGGKGQPSHSSQQRWIALLHAAKRAALRSSHHKTKTMATTEGDRGQLASGAHHFTTYTNVES